MKMILDYFVFSFNNLRRRGLRSWLTMLGIFIGIAAVVSLIALGQGLQDAITEQFEQIGSDKVVVQPRGRIGPPGSETSGNALTLEDVKVIEDINGVKNVVGILTKTSKVEFEDEITFRFIY
ncbi:MAG: ABC transporter permease, partial [Nanoarchaeota archaeon]